MLKVRFLFGGGVAAVALVTLWYLLIVNKESPVGPAENAAPFKQEEREYVGDRRGTARVFKLENDSFLIPPAGFKSWRKGVVTVLEPVIEKNCTKLFAGNKKEILEVREKSKNWTSDLEDTKLLNWTTNCTWVMEYFHDNLYTTKLERSFPVAYWFLVHNNPQQVLRLLRFLYRPMNTYCIHPDKKSIMTAKIFSNIAYCLNNVFIPSKIVDVTWGEYSLLQAQMSCLTDLVNWRTKQPEEMKWKYIINLCGKEVPLVSTHTTVSYLTKLNGTSSIMARRAPNSTIIRLKGKKLPHGFLYYKSMTYMALSFQFAHFMVTNSTAIELYQFFDGCRNPEEHFYASLYMVPGVPGGYDPRMKGLYFNVMECVWVYSQTSLPCEGKNVHHICIVTAGDLQYIIKRRALFYNKYFMEDDHTVMDCMEERLVERNKEEYELDFKQTESTMMLL